MPLSKRILHNSGLFAPPDLFAESTPTSALDDVNMARTIGVIQQIGNLSMFAAEMFDNLARLGEDTADRVREATSRCSVLMRQLPAVEAKVRQTEIAVVEDDIQKKNAGKRSAITIPTVLTKKTNCSQINAQYNTCSLPPQLWKIESIVPEDCMVAFSNPGFFFEEWLKGEQLRQEEQRKERKKNKELKKKTKMEKRKRRARDAKSSLAGHEKSLMRQRIDIKSKKNNALPPPLPPPDVDAAPEGLRQSSSFRIFESFDAAAGPPPEEPDAPARPPPPAAQQPLRRPPPGAMRKMPSAGAPPPAPVPQPKRPSNAPGRSPSMQLFPSPPPSEGPDTPPPPSPGPTPTTTPSLPGSPEPEMPPPPDDAPLRRPPSLNIPPQQLPQHARRKASILNYRPNGPSSPTKSGPLNVDGQDSASNLDAVKKTPMRRQSVIQSAKFMKSPSLVGSQPTKSPGINKMFSSSALSPEALAALTITPDSEPGTTPDRQGSSVTSGLTRRTSVGARGPAGGSPLDQQSSQPPKALPPSASNMKMMPMQSIVEDSEETESRASSQGGSRRGSVTKQRLESGGYQGGINPFTSEALAASAGGATPPDDHFSRRKSLGPQSSAVSALTDGFDSFSGEPAKDGNRITHQLSTFSEGPSMSPLNPTGISQSLLMEPTSPKGGVNDIGYNKDRFSMDINDAWYRNSFAPSNDRQPTNSNVNNAPVSEYAFVPMSTGDTPTGGAGRRVSVRSSSMPSDQLAAVGPRRKSILNHFKTSSNIESSGPTQADVDALNAARHQLQARESGMETVYSHDVHNYNSNDDAGDLEHVSHDHPSYDNGESVQPSEYDSTYYTDEYTAAGGDTTEDGNGGGGGGYYLATDGNYYYYEDSDYYGNADAAGEGGDEQYDQGEADQLWQQRTGFLAAIKEGDITLRRTPATEKYMDVRSDVLAQIRTGAVHLKKMQPTMKPSTEQRHDAIAAILSNRQKIAGSESDSDDYDSEDSGFGSDDDW